MTNMSDGAESPLQACTRPKLPFIRPPVRGMTELEKENARMFV